MTYELKDLRKTLSNSFDNLMKAYDSLKPEYVEEAMEGQPRRRIDRMLSETSSDREFMLEILEDISDLIEKIDYYEEDTE